MNIHYRFAWSLCGTLLTALAAGGTAAQAANSLELIIADGPHAGSYSLPTANIALYIGPSPSDRSVAQWDLKANFRTPSAPVGSPY